MGELDGPGDLVEEQGGSGVGTWVAPYPGEEGGVETCQLHAVQKVMKGDTCPWEGLRVVMHLEGILGMGVGGVHLVLEACWVGVASATAAGSSAASFAGRQEGGVERDRGACDGGVARVEGTGDGSHVALRRA